MQQRKLPLLFNIVFWLLYFLYEWLGLAALSGDYRDYFINACVALPLAFTTSWFTVDVLLKKYYERWPVVKFWICQLLISVLLLLAKRWVNYYCIYPRFFPFALHISFFSFGKLIVEWVNLNVIVGVYALFYFVQRWYQERQRVQDLTQATILAELELLKSQVQPHFIFNTLNNIYSTALSTSPETARLIAHLSSFLNYNLYDAKKDYVPLAAELDYIKSYVALQRNRYGEKFDAAINVFDNIQDISIAALLLMPLIENSFKHGIAEAMHESWLRIDISRQRDQLIIKIENSIELETTKSNLAVGGLGLRNVRRRVELLYPGGHTFNVRQELTSHLVILTIKLSDENVHRS